MNKADTCRVYVTPKISEAGWEQHPRSITELDALLPAILDRAFKGEF